jgi:hypothetical protein
MTTFISIKTDFYGIHKYPNAPDEVAFLRNEHRHKFYVTATIEVFHDDRELEFIMVKNRINEFIATNITSMPVMYSCEMMCKDIIKFIEETYCTDTSRKIKVSVFEDDENGAIVYNDAYDNSIN